MRIVIDCDRTGMYHVFYAHVHDAKHAMYQSLTSTIDDVYQRMGAALTDRHWWILMDRRVSTVYAIVTAMLEEHDLPIFDSTDRTEIYYMLKAHLQMMRGE